MLRVLVVAVLICALAAEIDCDTEVCGGCQVDDPTKCEYCPQFSALYASGVCQPTNRGDSISGPTFRIAMDASYAGASDNAILTELATYIPAPPSMVNRTVTRNTHDFVVLNSSLVLSGVKHIWFLAYPRIDVNEQEADLAALIVDTGLISSAWRTDVVGSKFANGASFSESVAQSRVFCTDHLNPALSTGFYQNSPCIPIPEPYVDVPWHETGGLPAVAILFLTIVMSIWFWCSWRSRNERWDAMDQAAGEKYMMEHPEEHAGWEEYDHMWEEKIPRAVEPMMDEII